MVEAYLGYAYSLVGRNAQAVALLVESAATDSGFHPALRQPGMDPSTGRCGRTGQGLRHADRAAEHYRAALALARDLGMRPLRANSCLGLGKLYRRVHRVGDARVDLSAAITMLPETDMALWLPEAKAELAEARSSASDRRRPAARRCFRRFPE